MKAIKRLGALCAAMIMAVSFTGMALAQTKAADPKTAAPAVQQAAKPAAKMVNINTASAKELQQLKGVGNKLAKAIVDYRAKNGAFKTPADLMKVKGIGKKTFEANQAIISVK